MCKNWIDAPSIKNWQTPYPHLGIVYAELGKIFIYFKSFFLPYPSKIGSFSNDDGGGGGDAL